MKNRFLQVVLLGWVCGCAAAPMPTPINNGVLTGPLNANRQALTNVGALVFSDGSRMTTSGSTLTNIPVQQWSENASNACTTTNLNSTTYRLTETMQLETTTMCVDAFGLYYSRSGGGVYSNSILSILPDGLRWTMTGSPRTTVSPGLWMIDDAPNALFPATHWTRVTINGVETTGRFSGDGSGLTNLPVTVPPGIITNDQSGVSLSGTFSGVGDALTGIGHATNSDVAQRAISTSSTDGTNFFELAQGAGGNHLWFHGTTDFSIWSKFPPVPQLGSIRQLEVTNGNIAITGTYSGDGSGLTNLPVKVPDGVVTNGGNFNGTLGSDSGNITNLGGMHSIGNHWANAFYGSEFGGDPDQGFTALFLGQFTGDGSGLTNVCATALAAGAIGDGSGLTNLPVTVTRFGQSLGATNLVLDLSTNEYEAITITNDIWVETMNVSPMKWKVVKILNTNNFQVHVQWPTNWSWANLVPEYIQSGKQFCLNITSFGTNDADIVGSWTGYLSLARPLLIPGQVPEPQGYWRLDETQTNAVRVDMANAANLVIQQYYRATNSSGDAWIVTNSQPGMVGTAFGFPSKAQCTLAKVALTTNLISAGPYTACAWVNVKTNYISDADVFYSGAYAGITTYDRYFKFLHNTNASMGKITIQSSYQFDLDKWYFLAAGWDGTNAWFSVTPQDAYSLYGRSQSATSLCNTNQAVGALFFGIGASSVNTAVFGVDEFGWWRSSLSDEVLLTIFTAGKNGQHIK